VRTKKWKRKNKRRSMKAAVAHLNLNHQKKMIALMMMIIEEKFH